jgi:hypothetical protein
MRLAAFRFLLFVVVPQSMIEPKAGPTAGSGVTRWCSAGRLSSGVGMTRARSASRERISFYPPLEGNYALDIP